MSSLDQEIPRPEYPRPQFLRKDNWINLNGEWDFAFDDLNIGLRERWYKKEKVVKFDKKIIVPFCFQSKLSGIEDKSFHDVVWYRREFEIPDRYISEKVLLHFGAVDYFSEVYLNGENVGNHEGGYIGFSIDVSNFVEKKNILVIRVEDPSKDLEIPRGKQYWWEKEIGIFYPRITGIWQTVWLEFVSPEFYIRSTKLTPDIDKSILIVDSDVYGEGFSDLFLSLDVFFGNNKITEEEVNLDFLGKVNAKRDRKLEKERVDRGQYPNPNRFKLKISIPINQLFLWDIANPNLYDIVFTLYNKSTQQIYDIVNSYFGMRKISVSEGTSSLNKKVLLNNKPLYQKLFLVQGYWSSGLYTAPSDKDLKLDVQYVKDFGFNGLRTHQKVCDPRFLYWCDKIGVLVWGEIGNAFQFSVNSQLRIINEFVAEIERDYNHPSIIVWTVLNEGWGVPRANKDQKKVDFTASLYYLMKSIDPTRLIIDDDGWWHTKTDLCTKHLYFEYESLPKTLEGEKSEGLLPRTEAYLKPYEYDDEPIIYSEIGGFGYDLHGTLEEKWGYRNVQSSEELLNEVLRLLKIFDERKAWIHGFCYTELYDQFQEINGLLTIEREPKFEPSKLKKELDKMFY